MQKCYQTSLDLCIQYNIRSIAFPCISTGVFGFNNKDACAVALKRVRQWLIDAKKTKFNKNMLHNNCIKNGKNMIQIKRNNTNKIETLYDRIDCIIFCCYDISNFNLYKKFIPIIFKNNNKSFGYSLNDYQKRLNIIQQKHKKNQKQKNKQKQSNLDDLSSDDDMSTNKK